MEGEPGAGSSAALQEILINKNNRLSQELEELHITSVCQKNARPIWRPRIDQTRKEQDGTLDSDSQHLELQSTTLSGTEDESEREDDGADNHEYSDSDLSNNHTLSPEATHISEMGIELFSEKEDWEKELNEACPYDEDDLEIIHTRSYCEGPLVWQDGETYNPSHDHTPSSRANIVEIPIVQGQFDDAED